MRALQGYNCENPKFTAAVNRLLQDRLVNGVKGGDGGMAIALNENRLGEVYRELRPWYAHPGIWALVVGAVALGAAGLLR